jgi:hypothetical protein
MDNVITILHKENNDEKINILEETEISKSVALQNLLSDTINDRDDPLYRILLLVYRF